MIRTSYALLTSIAIPIIVGPVLLHPTPQLIWNATASAPIGFYALYSNHNIRPHQLVAVRPPEPIARDLAEGGYLPRGVLLLKQVLAQQGQTVCRFGNTITIDHIAVGTAKPRDRFGRVLPRWQGCHQLRSGEVFLMNPAVPDSLDGRYFGPIPVNAIIARAHPIWTDDAGDGHFVWHIKNP